METSSTDNQNLQIKISNLGGPLCTIQAKRDWTQDDFKAAVEAATGVHVHEQQFQFGETLLVTFDGLLGDVFNEADSNLVLIRRDLKTWLATYPAEGSGPRRDQLGAYGWFESQGWKKKWPLQYAAMTGDVAAIHQLVADGHDPNVKMTEWFDSEPLGWAASLGQLNAVIALIQAGADPLRPPNKANNTPLLDAQRERHMEVVDFLIEYEEDWRQKKSLRKLILVKADSDQRCIFEHAAMLKQKKVPSVGHGACGAEGVLLTLSSHPGLAVIPLTKDAQQHDIWSYIELGVGPATAAIGALTDGTFIARSDDGRVFDIAHWKYEEGNNLVMLMGPGKKETRSAGGGRDFTVNNDGSISPTHAPHLALGIAGRRRKGSRNGTTPAIGSKSRAAKTGNSCTAM